MIVTVAINLFVVRYESSEAERLGSEVLFRRCDADAGDVWSSLTVIAAWPVRARRHSSTGSALVVARPHRPRGLPGGVDDGEDSERPHRDVRATSRDGGDMGVDRGHRMPSHQEREAPPITFSSICTCGCRQTCVDRCVRHLARREKDRLMAHYLQIVDAVIHLEPPPRRGQLFNGKISRPCAES